MSVLRKVAGMRSVAMILGLFCLAGLSSAAEITIDAFEDQPGCSFSDAIQSHKQQSDFGGCTAVGSYPGSQPTIFLPQSLSPYVLDTPFPDGADGAQINFALNLRGVDGRFRLQRSATPGTPPFRFFDVQLSGIAFENVELSGGLTADGGAIRLSLDANLTMTDSVLAGNTATNSGGAIAAFTGSTVLIDRSLIVNNSALNDNPSFGANGGAMLINGSTVTLRDSTVSGNQAEGASAIFVSTFGAGASARLNLFNVTLTDNESTNLGRGAIFISRGTDTTLALTIRNSLITGNLRPGSGLTDISVNEGGLALTQVDLQHNIIGHDGVTISQSYSGVLFNTALGNQILTSDGSNPTPLNDILLPLANNGGDTLTHGLPPMSPALDTGFPGLGIGTFPNQFWTIGCQGLVDGPLSPPGIFPPFRPDQRGVARPINGECDIGAHEGVVEPEDDACFVTRAANNKVVAFCL